MVYFWFVCVALNAYPCRSRKPWPSVYRRTTSAISYIYMNSVPLSRVKCAHVVGNYYIAARIYLVYIIWQELYIWYPSINYIVNFSYNAEWTQRASVKGISIFKMGYIYFYAWFIYVRGCKNWVALYMLHKSWVICGQRNGLTCNYIHYVFNLFSINKPFTFVYLQLCVIRFLAICIYKYIHLAHNK